MGGEREVSFELEIPAKAEYVCVARLLAGSIARQMGFKEESIEDLKIAVSEMCTNAIIHTGGGNGEKPPISVRYLAGGDSLTVEVRDQGPGFDTGKVLGQEGTGLKGKGFGIPLIKSLVDEFRCESSPQSGTMVCITKFVRSGEQDD